MKTAFPILVLLLSAIGLLSCSNPLGAEANTKPSRELVGHSPVEMPESGFFCGFLDSKGTMWFGTREDGLYKFEDNSFAQYTVEDGLCDNNITCIRESRNGVLMLGTNDGVCFFSGTEFSHLSIPRSDTSSVWLDKVYPVVNPNEVMSLLEDKEGNLWLGTNGAGVYRYDGSQFSQFLADVGKFYEDGLQHNIVLSMVEDLDQNIWFTSLSHGGVSRYDGQTFTHFREGLSDDFIRVAYCDKRGNLWIGTHGNHEGGLDLYDGNRFTAYHKTNDGISHNNVCGIYEDETGNLWMASGTSPLSIFDGEHFEVFRSQSGETFDRIRFVLGDREGNIWFGNMNGLWRFDGENVTRMMGR